MHFTQNAYHLYYIKGQVQYCFVSLFHVDHSYERLEPSFKRIRTHPIKIDLNKKLDPKQKTIQAFNIDAYLRVQKN